MKYAHLICRVLMVLIVAVTLALPVSAQERDLPSLIAEIEPAIVQITTYNEFGDQLSIGSGFIVDSGGAVVTNRHVLLGAAVAHVKMANGTLFPITGVWADNSRDDLLIVIIEGDHKDLPYLALSDSHPQKGERIIAIGSPLGLEQTVSDGIVSGLRNIEGHGDVIQITAPISPGSSGGPVINMRGEVIGVSTFQYNSGQNLNFALPASTIRTLPVLSPFPILLAWSWGLTNEDIFSTKDDFAAGLKLDERGDHIQARVYYKSILDRVPHYAIANYLYGCSLSQEEKHKEAIPYYLRATMQKPDMYMAHYDLGNSYARIRQFYNAIHYLNESIKLKPDYPRSHFVLGLSYCALGQRDLAVNEYRELLRLNRQDLADYLKKLL